MLPRTDCCAGQRGVPAAHGIHPGGEFHGPFDQRTTDVVRDQAPPEGARVPLLNWACSISWQSSTKKNLHQTGFLLVRQAASDTPTDVLESSFELLQDSRGLNMNGIKGYFGVQAVIKRDSNIPDECYGHLANDEPTIGPRYLRAHLK